MAEELLYSEDDDPLAGLFCPACGHTGSFAIAIAAVLDLTSDGQWELSEPEWEEDSWIECPACKQEGIVANFHHERRDP